MKVHHTGHHQAYTDNLNKALAALATEAPALAALPLAELLQRLPEAPEKLRGALRNSGGGYVNHAAFFVQWMAPAGAGVGGAPPAGALADAIVASFGSVDKFKEDFSAAAATVFGSGWAWLVYDKAAGALKVAATSNQDTPAMVAGTVPILGLDVWEHAYYLKYQNKRAAYISAWWNVVNVRGTEGHREGARATGSNGTRPPPHPTRSGLPSRRASRRRRRKTGGNVNGYGLGRRKGWWWSMSGWTVGQCDR
jgi:Fe-Mn family superoxide dismutase